MRLKILTKNKLFFLCLLAVFFCGVSGQEIPRRSFDQPAMQSYAEDSSFGYMDYQVRPPSIWERISWWFQRLLQRFFLDPNTPLFMRVVYYMILITVVGAAIFYIIRLRYGKTLVPDYQRYSAIGKSLESESEEDLDKLMEDALQSSDFRLAIRYLYLKSLLALSNKGLVRLKDSKSPYDYEKELGVKSANYRELAKTFEYVWDGDFRADQDTFYGALEISKKLETAE